MNNYGIVRQEQVDLLMADHVPTVPRDIERNEHEAAFLGQRMPEMNNKVTKLSETILLYIGVRFGWSNRRYEMVAYILNTLFDFWALFGFIGFIIAVSLI